MSFPASFFFFSFRFVFFVGNFVSVYGIFCSVCSGIWWGAEVFFCVRLSTGALMYGGTSAVLDRMSLVWLGSLTSLVSGV